MITNLVFLFKTVYIYFLKFQYKMRFCYGMFLHMFAFVFLFLFFSLLLNKSLLHITLLHIFNRMGPVDQYVLEPNTESVVYMSNNQNHV